MTTDTRLEDSLELIEADLQVAIANQRETMEIDRRVMEAISQQRAAWERAEQVAKEMHDTRTLLKVRG